MHDVPMDVIANDCWGGSLYQHLGREYTTPFVGLFLMGPCFVKLAEDVPGVLSRPLTFARTSRYDGREAAGVDYPLGMLGDVEVHFLHYPSRDAARSAWDRRLPRLDLTNVRIKADAQKDGMTDALVRRLLASHPGALVLGPPGSGAPVPVRRYTSDGAALLAPSRTSFDLRAWLTRGVVRPRVMVPAMGRAR